MENKKVCDQKIYGYDEELWYKVIKNCDNSGDRSITRLMPLLTENHVGNRILDLGCGAGRISNRLALRGYDVVGVDLSPRLIQDAAATAKKLGISNKTHYTAGNYTKLEGFGDQKFDAAICLNAPSWKTPLEITGFFSKLLEFMQPQALLIIQDTLKETFLHTLHSCPNVQNWYSFEGNLLALHSWRYNAETGVVSNYKQFYEKTDDGNLKFISKVEGESTLRSLKDYVAALKQAGWTVTKVERPSFDLLNLQEYNDPWLINTATIVAKLSK
jgi:cyclopropane fatty-acyl-phospholipid synthase-like methyltransferase